MSTWRNFFTYNKYSQITAHAVRTSFKEEHRIAAEKRGLTALKFQHWENGQGGPQIPLRDTEGEKDSAKA